MSERARFLLATLCGLVMALGTHIVIVLLAPRFAEADAFTRLAPTLTLEEAQIIAAPGGGSSWLPKPDPAVAVAACAFDLNEGPVRISTKTSGVFESLSFHAKGGAVFYAVTDRAAVRGELDLVVLTRRQLDEVLAEEDEEAPSRDVRIIAPRREGFVTVRVAAPYPSMRPKAEMAAKGVTCILDGEEDEEEGQDGAVPPSR